tara:strand:- start:1320 stop:1811 length:492 start_codon:yes stop_codon:yes gene_type:complete
MQIKRIERWLNNLELRSCLSEEKILSWLNEEGSITRRISSKATFKLEILNDDLGRAEEEEYKALELDFSEVRIREVILYGDSVPLVFARSIIPTHTARKGYPSLGTIGSKPLGDLIFQSELFIKTHREFAKFHNHEEEIFWGRRTHYLVRGYPLSVMEVFLST